MKYLLLTLGLFLQAICYCQDKAPVEVTPAIEKKLKEEIEMQVPSVKKKLVAAKESETSIEFEVDTFRIERLSEKWITLDYGDFGMRDANYEAAKLYDSLMNKYYKKLLSVLKSDDKKILIQTQKAWLSFRDGEVKLIETISKDEYSGGGTMQQLTESSMYLTLVKNRTVDLFSHYQRATQTF